MSLFLEGVIAGYGIAIPVRAVAVLIVNMGMRCGFKIGFSAGAGAAAADVIYATIVVVTGTALVEMLVPIAPWLRIFSGLLLLGMGFWGLWKGLNHANRDSRAEYAFMRPFDHPLVALGPALQIFRGALLAVAFLPFRKIITESARGWLYLVVALFILMHVGADAADPGNIESFIYADFSAAIHFSTWPEQIFSMLVFGWLFHTWERNPGDKRLSIPLIVLLVIAVVVGILGFCLWALRKIVPQ